MPNNNDRIIDPNIPAVVEQQAACFLPSSVEDQNWTITESKIDENVATTNRSPSPFSAYYVDGSTNAASKQMQGLHETSADTKRKAFAFKNDREPPSRPENCLQLEASYPSDNMIGHANPFDELMCQYLDTPLVDFDSDDNFVSLNNDPEPQELGTETNEIEIDSEIIRNL